MIALTTPQSGRRSEIFMAKTTAKKSTKQATSPDFEKSLQELESLVEQMESGEQSLDDSLKTFERGVQLTRECQQALQQAEQRVQILLEKNGTAELTAFEGDA